jgi:hypothetical protein
MSPYFQSPLCVLLLSLWVGSCTAPIELQTNDAKPSLVVYGYLTEYVVQQTIQLSSSSPYFEAKANQPVSDAVVVIETSENQTYAMEEMPSMKGLYRTVRSMSAIPGVTYRLRVEVDFDRDGTVETYEASTTMPPPFLIDSIGITAQYLMGYKHYAMNLYAQEEPTTDFYFAKYILNDTLMEYQISNFLVFDDNGINDQYLDGITLMYFDDKDNHFAGGDNSTFIQSGGKVTLCISRIEQGYYDFLHQSQQARRGENPFFGGPASNITTNISNGGVGYFTSFCTSEASAFVP